MTVSYISEVTHMTVSHISEVTHMTASHISEVKHIAVRRTNGTEDKLFILV